jgi:Ca2+-binding EF-hand superfamily protein
MGEKPTHDELTKMINDVNPNDNKGYLTFKDWIKIMSMCLENADNTEQKDTIDAYVAMGG